MTAAKKITYSARKTGDGFSFCALIWLEGDDHPIEIVGMGHDEYYYSRKEAIAAAKEKAIALGLVPNAELRAATDD